MQAYDLLMIIILALAVVWGAWKGLAWQIASIASIGLSYFVALHFRLPLAGLITASPPWNIFLSMLILFLGTGLLVWIAFNLVSEFIERVKLKEFDRQLGAVFGAAKGVLLCVIVTLFSVALLGDAQRQAICNSKSGYYIAVIIDRADMVIPHELHDVLQPYIQRLDETVGQPPRQAAGWQIPEALQNLFSGLRQPATQPAQPTQPPPSEPKFPPADFASRPASPPPLLPHPGTIEAQPAAPHSDGSFRTR